VKRFKAAKGDFLFLVGRGARVEDNKKDRENEFPVLVLFLVVSSLYPSLSHAYALVIQLSTILRCF
jgi:hypothetical protein